MKLKVEDLTKHTYLAIAVMHVMAEEAHKKTADFCKMFNVVPGANSDVEVNIQINGVEVDFGHFIKVLERQHNEMVESTAKEQIRARVGQMMDRLNEIMQQAEELAVEEIEATFPGKKVW